MGRASQHRQLKPTVARAEAAPALLPLGPLTRFLQGRDLLEGGPVEVCEIGSGHSNPTFLVTQGDTELVVRRPPPPPFPPSTHDVLREARVIAALEGCIPVPRVLAVCESPAVLGAPFYVMTKIDGWVITDTLPTELSAAEDRRRIAEQLIEALVRLHAVDWHECGLSGFGRPSGYLERQVRRFWQLWPENRTRDLPLVDRLGRWLVDRMPEAPATTIVHGDYRLGNAMFAKEPPARLVAVFDWEMATLGDPLADLGYFAAFWVQPEDPPLQMFELSRATRAAGFPSREEMIALYAERSGRSTGEIYWYEVLALWKLAILMEGNYKRARDGQIDDPYLEGFGEGVVELLDCAAGITAHHDRLGKHEQG